MQYLFRVNILAEVTLGKREIELLFVAADNHYDYSVREMASMGGFVFGLVNRSKLQEIVVTMCTTRVLQLMVKSLEIPMNAETTRLGSQLHKILTLTLQKQDELNIKLSENGAHTV